MIFESRTLQSDNGRIEVCVLAEGNKLSMLSVSYKKDRIEEYWDGDYWIKYTLFPALERWLKHCCIDGDEETLKDINSGGDRFDMYEALCRAESLGWMVGIKD